MTTCHLPSLAWSPVWLALTAVGFVPTTSAQDARTPDSITGTIRQAGTAQDEMERLQLLRQLDGRPDLDAMLRANLAKLLPAADDWANGKSRVPRQLCVVRLMAR
jgi:hypothetical protein